MNPDVTELRRRLADALTLAEAMRERTAERSVPRMAMVDLCADLRAAETHLGWFVDAERSGEP